MARKVTANYSPETNEVRNHATKAWGTVNSIYEVIPDFLWDVSTEGHGGLVARYKATQLPEYAYYTYAGVEPSFDYEYVFALFEEDEDWANILANNEDARKRVYEHWHVLIPYEEFCSIVNDQYAMNQLKG